MLANIPATPPSKNPLTSTPASTSPALSNPKIFTLSPLTARDLAVNFAWEFSTEHVVIREDLLNFL